jgi:hypothetical protein
MPSPWIEHIRKFAAENNLSYGCAMTTPECRATYTPVKKAKKPKKPTKKELKKQSLEKQSLADRVQNALERERLQESVPAVNPKNISMRGIEIKKPYVAPVKAAAKPKKKPLIIEEDDEPAAAKPVKAAKKPAAAAADPEKAAAKALKELKAERRALFKADPEAAEATAAVAWKAAVARADARREYYLAHPAELEAFKAANAANAAAAADQNWDFNASIGIRAAKAAEGKYPPHPKYQEPIYSSEELKVQKLFEKLAEERDRLRQTGPMPSFATGTQRQKYLKEKNAALVKIEKQLWEGYGIQVKRDFMDDTVDWEKTANRNISLMSELDDFKYKNNMKKLKERYNKYVKLVAEYGNKPHNTIKLKEIKAVFDIFERENIPDDVSPFGYFLKKYGNFFGEENEILSRRMTAINSWLKGEI